MSESGEGRVEEKQAEAQEVYPRQKIDIRSLVAVVPPASTLFARERELVEKRVKVRYGTIERDKLALSPVLASQLKVADKIVLVVAGRKRFELNVLLDDSLPPDVVVANGELLRAHGVADNSIATVRRP